MGCDIHTRVEYLKTVNGVTSWYCGDYFKKNPYGGVLSNKEGYEKVELCGDRNYLLFATLADVRNYSNTAYISKPKEIPLDACKETIEEYNSWEGDAHSASYFTLKELMDWNKEDEVLRPLISELKRRGEELNLWWTKEQLEENAHEIRIVFWFDN